MLKGQRFFNVLVITAMLMGLFVLQPQVAAQPAGPDLLQPAAVDDVIAVQSAAGKGEVMYEIKGATGPATYIIQLEAAPLASYQGEVSGLMATSPVATGAAKLDVNSAASRAYRDYLAAAQKTLLNQMQKEVGRTVEVLYTYDVAYNGLAVVLTPKEAVQVAQMPGVLRVIRNFKRYIQTDTTPEFLNAWGIWSGENTGAISGTMGEGILVGIIDTGINMDNPAFADVGDDSYDHTNPLGAGNYTGWCNPAHPSYDPTLVCNDKLIGVYSYPDSGNSPEDDNSHGSHTASTTAGNVLHDVEYDGYTFTQISGMAPHANVIAYDVCTADGCQLTSIQAAIQDAVTDGVDVINYSIGGGPTNPWDDPDSLAYLAARDAGVFVATSAGNDGPDPGTAGSPGNSPWLTTVANTTIGRVLANTVDVTGPGTVPSALQGIAAIRGPEGPAITADIEADIIYSGDVDPANITGCVAFPDGSFTDSIALIQRGGCTFAEKVNFATAAGAIAVIVFNNAGGPPMSMGALVGTTIPSVFVSLDDGSAIRDWVQAETDPTARINAGVDRVVNNDWADILAAGSSRGPNVNPNFIKPDIAAPGTNIFAAYSGDADSFGMMSGTSMASPHVAGAAALMRALYPGWTEAEIQSALMMTSWMDMVKDDATTPADPFDVGAGRLDLTNAALAGLVLNETTANFEAADPALDGDPTTLNLASLANAACLKGCSWERTFRNTTGEAITWTVSFTGDVALAADPAVFTVAGGATQVVEFTADVSEEDDGVWLFGTVILTANDPALPVQHLPVAVLPTSGVLPEMVTVDTHRNAGVQMIEDVQAIEILTMTIELFGLVQADLHDISLYQDPTNGDAYDDLSQVYYTFATVEAGAKRMVAEVTASEAPDVDLFVLYDTGTGYAEVCASATGTWAEYCDLTDPAAGDYLIVVQNWQGSANQPDDITLAVGVVPGADASNMVIEGPASVAEMEPFDLLLFWDTPEMVTGDRWYGAFSLGSEPSKAGNIGTIPVDVVRWEDDVVKDATAVKVGDDITITYQLTVQPNISDADYTLALTDTIPTGLTYVAGSATATAGVVNVADDTLTWAGMMNIPAPGQYLMSTSEDDAYCTMPLANSGAYVDLLPYGPAAISAINGDMLWFTAFSTGDPFTYWDNQYTGIGFTDDGMAFFDSTPGTTPWVNQDIPNAADPNNLLAVFWNDWEVVYDGPTNRGVSLVTLGGTSATGGAIIEYDDVQAYGEPGETLDFEVFVWRTPVETMGDPDIIFAYDNISLTTPIEIGTIGLENALGTAGVKYAYDDAALQTLQDGMAICFDWYVAPTDPVVITYQVTVDNPTEAAEYTNVVEHDTDAPNTAMETTSHTVTVGAAPTIAKTVSPENILNFGDSVTYTISLANPNVYPIDAVTMTDTLPLMLTFEDWIEQPAGATLVPPRTIEWAGTIPAEGSVDFVFVASTPEDTHVILVDIVNTAYMGYPGGTDSDSVSFSLLKYTLEVNVVGEGTVQVDPAETDYFAGSVVTLTAEAAIGWEFVGWEGDLTSADNPATITMDADKVVTATFEAIPYTLDIGIVGEGTVSVDPEQETYLYGDVVTLTAVPSETWYFAGWSGDISSADNPYILTMDGSKVVTATFTQEPPVTYTLNVAIVGQGTVMREPYGTTFISGTEVLLTAVPATGWEFAGWSGDVVTDTAAISIVMDANKDITATFAALYTLDVNTVGEGTVTVAPEQETYLYGDVVTLTAVPSETWYFGGWSGDIGSADNPYVLTMDGSKVVTATFTQEPPVTYTLNVTIVGQGTVTREPHGTTFISGTQVLLTAAPATGWEFAGWSGDVVTDTAAISIVMDANKDITATFTEITEEHTIFLPLIMRAHTP